MSAHTPGPWKVTPRINKAIDIQHSFADVKGAISLNLCRVHARDSWAKEAEANALLIAAAPDLLEQLNALVAMVLRQEDFNDDGDGMMLDRARDAINKATEV